MSLNFFQEQTRLGNVFHSHNVTHGAVTVLSTTCTGLVLFNPIGSKKLLVMKSAHFSDTTITAAATIGLVVSDTVGTVTQTGTAVVIHNGKLNGSNGGLPVGLAFSIATLLETPVWYREMGKVGLTGTIESSDIHADMDGDTIVMPGTYIAFATLTTARVGMCDFTWAEIDA